MPETISVERKGRVAIIRITRPKALNALNSQVLAEMLAAAEDVDADTPMGKRAMELYEEFVEREDGEGMDFSAMLPRFEKRGRG